MSTALNNNCRWCGMIHGPICFAVKALEFFEDGITVKRVEFKTAADDPQQISVAPSVFMISDRLPTVATSRHGVAQ